MTALFVVATRSHRLSNVIFRPAESFDIDEGETLVRGNGVENLKIELTTNGVLIDRVFMKAGEGENCSKFSLSQYAPIIYVPKDGKEYAIAYREGAFSLCLPGHNFTTNWNGGSQGHDDELLPLGNGVLLLAGFGAAYALSKRKKED